MSETKSADERRKRLEALRSKKQEAKNIDFSRMGTADPRMTGGNGPASDDGDIGSLAANFQNAGGKPQVERMLEFLTFDGPGAKKFPGTDVNSERLKRLLQFINMRSQEKETPKWVSQIKRVLGCSGEKTSIKDLEKDKVNALVNFLRSRTRKKGAAPAQRAAAVSGGSTSAGAADSRLTALEKSMQDLLVRTSTIEGQLTAVRKELDRLAKEGPSATRKEAAAPVVGEPVADWFDEMIDKKQ